MEVLQDHPGGEESRPPSEQGRGKGEVMSEEAKERARKRLMKVGRRGGGKRGGRGNEDGGRKGRGEEGRIEEGGAKGREKLSEKRRI